MQQLSQTYFRRGPPLCRQPGRVPAGRGASCRERGQSFWDPRFPLAWEPGTPLLLWLPAQLHTSWAQVRPGKRPLVTDQFRWGQAVRQIGQAGMWGQAARVEARLYLSPASPATCLPGLFSKCMFTNTACCSVDRSLAWLAEARHPHPGPCTESCIQ